MAAFFFGAKADENVCNGYFIKIPPKLTVSDNTNDRRKDSARLRLRIFGDLTALPWMYGSACYKWR